MHRPSCIREVGPDDWADWRHARLRSLTEDPGAFAGSVTMWTGDRDTEANWRDRLSSPGAYFLADDGSDPVGMVAASPTDAGVELISMWVAVEARRRGIGGRLIDAVISWAGDSELRLRVVDGNAAALAAYESRGFVLHTGCDDEGCRTMTLPPKQDSPPPRSR
ncbi:MAG: N-acetyltransferase family protein [Aeromicrobium sp.]